VAAVLKDEAGSVFAAVGKARLRNALVAAQISLSLLLLIAAGLFLRSIDRAQSFDPGFQPRGVLLASLDLFSGGYDRARGLEFQRRLLERVRALPGVESAALSRRAPLGMGGSSSSTVDVDGYTPPKNQPAWGYISFVSADYWTTMRMAMLRGREIAAQDTDGAPMVAVINETMAQRYWGQRDPVGSWLALGNDRITVVGITKDSKLRSLNEPPAPHFYLSMPQWYRPDITLHVRSTGDPERLGAAVRSAVASLDASLPVFNVVTLEQHIRGASIQQRMSGMLLVIFGAIALSLAAIGIYGVISYNVAQRTREIGIRIALGAERSDVLRLVLRHGMGLMATGAAIGLAAAVPATMALRKLLFGVSPADPLTFGGVVFILAAVALAACLIPARRATRVEPMKALHYE
jgi:predicted permease